METSLVIALVGLLITPAITVITIAMKSRSEGLKRLDAKETEYINNLKEDLKELRLEKDHLEKRLDEQQLQIRTIQTEIKNRDAEYLKLFQEHTTLKAQYENLMIDHGQLKKDYDATVLELSTLKEDIKLKAEQVAKEITKS